jgi:hypothetical protein
MRAGAGVDGPFRPAKASEAVGDGCVSHASDFRGSGVFRGSVWWRDGQEIDPKDRAHGFQAKLEISPGAKAWGKERAFNPKPVDHALQAMASPRTALRSIRAEVR